MSMTRRLNRYFVLRSDKNNFGMDVSVRWRLGQRRQR